jgi:hypothetical protein
MQLCPSYSNQPHAVLEHICQTSIGPNGQLVTATVIKYYQRMINTVRPFATQQKYVISICERFIQDLEKKLLHSFKGLYTNHSTIHNLDGSYQRRTLPTILAAVQATEINWNQIQEIARGMLVSQGFFVKAPGNAGAYASQSENMLGHYKVGATNISPPCSCWGCGGNHSWMRKGKVVCTCGSDPQVFKATADRNAAWKAALKGGGGKSKSQTKGEKTIEYKDLDKKSKKKMGETILEMSANGSSTASSTITSSNTSTPSSAPSPIVFMITALVFNITPPSCHVLPVPIQAAFLHITLQLGSTLGCANCPAISCIVNTAAALMTGNLHFFAEVAKAYPHTVTSIHSLTEHSPITLSRIVQQGENSVTTNLTVGFQFHLPYLTCEGTPTNFVVAAGHNVTVNIILGLPFITQTKMVIDTSDRVAKLRAFDTPPFPLDFRCAICAIPVIDKKKAIANAALHANIVKEIDSIVAHVSTKTTATYLQKAQDTLQSILMPAKRAQSVNFHDISSNSSASKASIGPSIDHSNLIADAYADMLNLDDYTSSV